MHIKYSFHTALSGITTHKSRSALTVLGIVIGITSIIIVMSLGQGAQDLILNQVQGMGSRTVVVIPGREPKGPADSAQVFSDSLKERDLTLLRNKVNVPTASKVMPILFGGESSSYGGETFRLTIFGASEDIPEFFDLAPERGIFFTEEDIRGRADVVVIGDRVREELFGSADVLGQRIRIKDRNFRIIGILPKKGQVSFFNFDETAIIPYTTAQQYIFSIKYFHRFFIEADSEATIKRTVEDATQTLRNAHNITNPDKDDFFIQTQADLASRLGVITDVLTLFLVAVAAISLVVGGIGIMNIMLVSVTERTREIGLRKALGATDRDILTQFLLEAMMLTGIGGCIGIILGISIAFGTSLILTQVIGFGWEFAFPLNATLIALGVSTGIGLLFGIYPARQAARKSPIEALRYE